MLKKRRVKSLKIYIDFFKKNYGKTISIFPESIDIHSFFYKLLNQSTIKSKPQ